MAGLRVTISCEPGDAADGWVRELRRSRMEVTVRAPSLGQFSPGMDILISDFSPNIAQMLPWEPGSAQSAFILLVPQNVQYDEGALLAAGPHGVLEKPFRASALRAACLIAWSQFRYERRLQDRISRLDENLRAIRDVERAKLILMNERKLDEAAAYKAMRDLAMKRQTTVASIADAIVRGGFFGAA